MLRLWQTAKGILWALTIVVLVIGPDHSVDARSNGLNVDQACSEMTPFHGVSSQTQPTPFSVTFAPASYRPGIPVRVTIKACDPTRKPFKGFMIQARRAVVGSNQAELLGSFTPVAGTQQTCSGKGLIHKSKSEKTTLAFEWNPPSSSEGHVQFRVTFVQAFSTFWAATRSEVLKDASTPLFTNVLSATSRASECSSTTPTVDPLLVPSGCGTDKGCIHRCSATSCGTVISWEDNNDSVLYTVTSKVSSPTSFVAIGFSNDQVMGADSVTGCASASDGSVIMFNAENTGRKPPTPFQDNDVQLTRSSMENNVLSCTFNRLKAASANGKRFDVTQSWIILFAKGDASVNGQTLSKISYHNDDKFFTSAKYSSNDKPNLELGPWPSDIVPTNNGPVQDPSTLTVPSECGLTLGCVSKCSGSSCETVVTWQESGNSVLYSLSSTVSSSTSFVAVGFSSDDTMGGDSVIGCAAAADGTVVKFSAQNTGQEPPKMFDDSSIILKRSSIKDKVLSCTIERPKAASADGKRFDVSKKWIILFARGGATVNGQSVSVSYHGEDKFLTSSKYSSSDTPNVGGAEPDYPLVKVHGSLMVAAWLFFASIGVIAARYYKPVWTNDLFSQKVWFQIHRTCMVLVFLITVAGFVVIFLEVEDWSELYEDDEYLEYHPIMGVIVTALTVLNPLMALIRPHPGTKNRPIFNWAHWFVGTVAHILAVITIFFGIQLQKAQAPDYMVYILAGYVGWQVFVALLLEMLQCCGREQARQELYEMDNLSNQKLESKESEKTLHTKRIILMLHVFVLTVLTAIIIGFVSIGEEDL